MSKAAVTEAQIRRAVKGAIGAGVAVGAIEVDPKTGTIRILPKPPKPEKTDPREPEPW